MLQLKPVPETVPEIYTLVLLFQFHGVALLLQQEDTKHSNAILGVLHGDIASVKQIKKLNCTARITKALRNGSYDTVWCNQLTVHSHH